MFKLHLVDYEAQALKQLLLETEQKLASAETAIERATNQLEKFFDTLPDAKEIIEKAHKALREYRRLP